MSAMMFMHKNIVALNLVVKRAISLNHKCMPLTWFCKVSSESGNCSHEGFVL